MSAAEHASKASSAMQAIEWRSKWPRTLRFDFIVISPIALMTDIDNNDADDNNADEDALLVYLAFS